MFTEIYGGLRGSQQVSQNLGDLQDLYGGLQRFIESSTEFQRNSEKIREIQGNLKSLRKFTYSFSEF